MKLNIYAQYDKVRKQIQFTFMAENDQVAIRTYNNRLDMDEKAIGIKLQKDDYGLACIAAFETDLIFKKDKSDTTTTLQQPIILNEICYIVDSIPAGLKPRDFQEINEKNKGVIHDRN